MFLVVSNTQQVMDKFYGHDRMSFISFLMY